MRLSYYQQQRCSREGGERKEERKEGEREVVVFFLFKFESVKNKIIQKYDDAHGGVVC